VIRTGHLPLVGHLLAITDEDMVNACETSVWDIEDRVEMEDSAILCILGGEPVADASANRWVRPSYSYWVDDDMTIADQTAPAG
jgi:hypothetical protein